MKRSALFGRAPVVHDLTAAFTIWGFLDQSPASALVEMRETMFAEIKSSHHYFERREVVDKVPDQTLRWTHQKIETQYQADWQELFIAD